MERRFITQRIERKLEWSPFGTAVQSLPIEEIQKAIKNEYKGQYTIIGEPVFSFDESYIYITFEAVDFKEPSHPIGYNATPLNIG